VTVTLKGTPAVVEDAALTAKWSTGMVASIMRVGLPRPVMNDALIRAPVVASYSLTVLAR
jgi:hypothetical protein